MLIRGAKPIRIIGVTDNQLLDNLSSTVPSFSPASTVSPLLPTYMYGHVAVTRNQMGEAWIPSKGDVISKIREYLIDNWFDLLFVSPRTCTYVYNVL